VKTAESRQPISLCMADLAELSRSGAGKQGEGNPPTIFAESAHCG